MVLIGLPSAILAVSVLSGTMGMGVAFAAIPALFSAVSFGRAGYIDWKRSLPLAATMAMLALLGAVAVQLMQARVLWSLYFAAGAWIGGHCASRSIPEHVLRRIFVSLIRTQACTRRSAWPARVRMRDNRPQPLQRLEIRVSGTKARKQAGGRKAKAALANGAAATEVSDRMMAVLKQFRVVVLSIRRHYERVEKRSGLSGSQLWAMAKIASRDGLTVGELAKELGVHPSTASNMLERLASLGLVTKRRAGKDQRVVRLHASASGRSALKSAPQPLIGVLQQALSRLPPASLDALHRRMNELIEVMDVRDISAAQSTPLSDL